MIVDQTLFGQNLFGDPATPTPRSPLAKKFGVFPSSVLDARQGEWQTRKAAWLSMGIKSEVGRGGGGKGEHLTGNSMMDGTYRKPDGSTTSIPPSAGASVFDPVLCEMVYRWFCPPQGQVVDPFGGGSVRGVVASHMGLRYHGIELRPEQVQANRDQAATMCPDNPPEWVCGDSRDLLPAAPLADLVFTCPPYGDLEVYSDDPRDLSNMAYPDFLVAYRRVVWLSAMALKPNRLAVVVVGDFRDPKTTTYRGFVADTINVFRDAGMELYNDAVLVTMVATLSMRVEGQFKTYRKLGKTHQNVLVFLKGDCRAMGTELGALA